MSLRSRLLGLTLAAHVFPAVASAIAVALFAALAGAPLSRTLVLGLSMLLVHGSIGSVNDIVDLEDDRRTQPEKPIVRGLVGRRLVIAAAIVEATAALVLASLVNWPCFLIILAILVSGMVYNFWAKRTIFSWVPYAVFVPSVAVGGFWAADNFDPRLWLAYPIGALLAVALNLANTLPDLKGDLANDIRGLTHVLGEDLSTIVIWCCLAAGTTALVALEIVSGRSSMFFYVLCAASLLAIAAMIVDRVISHASSDSLTRGWYASAVCSALIGAAFVVGVR